MTIDLSQLDALGVGRDFRIEILAQDRDQDGQLEKSDFVERYGRGLADQFYANLEAAVQGNDPQAFGALLKQLEARRGEGVARSFASQTEPHRGALQGLGVVPGQPIDLQDLNPTAPDPAFQQRREQVPIYW